MVRAALIAALLGAGALAPQLIAQDRIPIDIGLPDPAAAAPSVIDILTPLPEPDAAEAALVKECEDAREAGVVAGEIVVCRALDADTAQLYSGSRAAWLRRYGEKTQGLNTIPPPDVAGAGIFRGQATVSGMCFIPPCPAEAPLIIDVKAIPPPPAGSDAERVARGLTPLEDDAAPLSDEDRRRVEAELGLPEAPETGPGGQ